MKIVVLDGFTQNPGDVTWDPIANLAELVVFDRTSEHEMLNRADTANILVTNKTPIRAEHFEQLPQLKMISLLATGYDMVDVATARAHHVPVCNVPVYGTESVAQHIFAMLLSFMHRPFEHDRAIRQGRWSECKDFSFWLLPLAELAGQTMGVVGWGRIGSRVGTLSNAFGMPVLSHNRSERSLPAFQPFQFCSLEELFERSDVISLNCPQTAENTRFVNAKLIERMKPNAILINASRGGLINEDDLAEALNRDRIAGALLDVVSVEPILDTNPLLSAKNCLLTPHQAWATVAARKRLMDATAANISAFLAGNPINVVNA